MNGPLLLVRPPAQARAQMQRLAQAGIRACVFSVLDTEPDSTALAALPAQAAGADWLFFISPSCIDIAWPALAPSATHAQLACVGGSSGRHLATLSGRAVLYPEQGNDSSALLALPELQTMAGQRVLIVRGEGGRAQLGETLAARGAAVGYAEVYRRVAVDADWALFDRLPAPTLLLTSSDSVQQLFQQAGDARLHALRQCRFIALHPRIADSLRRLGAANIDIASDEQALLTLLRSTDNGN